jgi:hypothetical protein
VTLHFGGMRADNDAFGQVQPEESLAGASFLER